MFEYHQYQNKDLKRYYVKLQEIKDKFEQTTLDI